jgi:hypothetical protein
MLDAHNQSDVQNPGTERTIQRSEETWLSGPQGGPGWSILMCGVFGSSICRHRPGPWIASYVIKSKKLLRSPQWILKFVAGRQ